MKSSQSPGRSYLPTSKQAYVVSVFLLMYILAYMDRNVLALLVDPIKRSMAISDVQFSLLHGLAFGAFYAVFGLPMGYLVDRYSRRWIIFCGIAVWSLATVTFGLVHGFTQMALARFAVGAGEATLVPAAYSTIASIVPPHRTTLGIAIFTAGSSLGVAIAVAIGGFLMHRLTIAGGLDLPFAGLIEPWRAVMVLIGLPGLLIALLAFTLPEMRQPRTAADRVPLPASESTEPFVAFLGDNKIYLISMIGGLSMVFILSIGVGAWLPAVLMRQYAMNIEDAGILISFISVSTIVGFIFTGLISDYLFRHGRNDAHILPILFGLPVIVVAAIIGFHFANALWLVIICAALINIMAAMGNAIAAHVQLATPPNLRGRMAALMVTCQQLCGISLGPLLVALITDYVFADPRRVGDALAMMAAIIGTVGFILLFIARAPARAAIAQQIDRNWI